VTVDAAAAFDSAGGWPAILSKLFRREDLTTELATLALTEIFAGRAKPSQIGAFLAAMRTKGESVEEMVGLSRAMQAHAEHLEISPFAIDTCGTGGDRSGTINVSTMAAIVAPAPASSSASTGEGLPRRSRARLTCFARSAS